MKLIIQGQLFFLFYSYFGFWNCPSLSNWKNINLFKCCLINQQVDVSQAVTIEEAAVAASTPVENPATTSEPTNQSAPHVESQSTSFARAVSDETQYGFNN